jgi:hypothetical protein
VAQRVPEQLWPAWQQEAVVVEQAQEAERLQQPN